MGLEYRRGYAHGSTPMNASRITVIVIVLLAVAVLLVQRSYLSDEGGEKKLAAVDCAGLQPTVFELQGRQVARAAA